MEEKAILELSKDEATEIAVALAFSVQSTLEDLGKDDEVTKSIERSGRVVNEVLKLFPEIMDNPIFPHDFWEKFKQYRGHPSELRRLGKKEMQNVLSGKEKINEVPLEIKEKSAETLAEEIVDFMKKEYPEGLDEHDIPAELLELFWYSKGMPSKYNIEDPATRLKIVRAETLADRRVPGVEGILPSRYKRAYKSNDIRDLVAEGIKEVPSEIKEKSAETLAGEIIELARKEYPESLNERYIPNEVFELFWNNKGVSKGELSMYEIQDPAIRLKMKRAETLAEELKVPEEEKRKIITTEEINEKEAFLEIKEKSAETLAEEIIELTRKEYPESLNEQYIPNEILKLFWNSKGILPNYDIQDPAIRIKMERAEALATKGTKHKEEFNIFVTGATNVEIKDALQFLEEFRKKFVGEIVEELLEFAEKKSIFFSSPDGIITDYFKEKNIDYSELQNYLYRHDYGAPTENIKREYDIIRKIQEIRRSNDFHSKLSKKQLQIARPKIIEWAKRKGIVKITRADVDLFLVEEELMPPRGRKTEIRNILYRSVTLTGI